MVSVSLPRLLAVLAPVALAACSPKPQPLGAYQRDAVEEEQRERGLVVRDIVAGEGDAARDGDGVRIHYLLTLPDGKVVDSSHDGKPLFLLLGSGQGYVEGLGLGLIGMRVFGLREIVVPPALGYRGRAMGKIPPKADLHFFVEMTDLSRL